jgi:hypothetical protein
LNPSNTIKIVPNEINVIKEEAFEESIEQFQLKKNNLKIIIPERSNDELEPSTSGSSNVKLSPNNPSPLIDVEKNKNNIYPNINIEKLFNKDNNEEDYKNTAHFVYEENSCKSSSKENKNSKRPSTPNTNINRYRSKYNPPLTCDNKNMDKYMFKYNFETKKNGVIVPIEDKKINKIQRQNLFKVGYKNNNINTNQKKTKPISSRIGQIFSPKGNSPINSSLISMKNNLNEKNQNKNQIYNNNKFNKNNNNKINNLKKNNNNNNYNINKNQKNLKKKRANSVESKINNKNRNAFKKNDSNELDKENPNKKNDNNIKEKKRNCSSSKNNYFPYIQENKLSNVQNKLEVEINNLFKILPEDFEKDPEIKNNFELIVQNIHGLKDYIYKNSQYSFGKNKNN